MDVERGMRAIPPRAKRDHLLTARYTTQTRVADTVSKWSGYADPVKQAMADSGLIPQSPVIGEVVDTRGMVRTKVARPRDEKLYRGKDNGKPRGEVVVQCTTAKHPTPIVVGSFWPRVRGEDGELVVRSIYDARASVELESVVDTGDPTLTANITESVGEFTRGLFEIARKGVAARKK